jgi:hypothetical protein
MEEKKKRFDSIFFCEEKKIHSHSRYTTLVTDLSLTVKINTFEQEVNFLRMNEFSTFF